MPDKNWNRLNPIDLDLRIVNHVGMEDGIKQLIIRQCGFELYNTRPYHNYETWSDGWIVFGRKDGKAMPIKEAFDSYLNRYKNGTQENYILVSREDLDDAIRDFIKEIRPDIVDDLKDQRTRMISAGQRAERRAKRWR